jgi:hypothetical protein
MTIDALPSKYGLPSQELRKTPMAATTRPSSAATSATGPRSASSSDPEFRSPSRPARPIRPRGPPLRSEALCCPHIVQDRCHGVSRDRERRSPRRPFGSQPSGLATMSSARHFGAPIQARSVTALTTWSAADPLRTSREDRESGRPTTLGVDNPECAGSRPAGRPRSRMRDGESHFPGVSPECAVERGGERLKVDWFDQVSVEASLPRSHHIGVAAEGGHCDRSQLTKSILRPATFQNGNAIEVWHPKIQQKQVGRAARRGLRPLRGRYGPWLRATPPSAAAHRARRHRRRRRGR